LRPASLRRAGILTKEAANEYPRAIYIPGHNARFGKLAAEPGSAFVAYTGAYFIGFLGRPIGAAIGVAVEKVLCVREDRVVGRDNCVSWSTRSLQIPAQRHRRHYIKATVCVHEYPDGRLAIFDGPRQAA
jgi:hypothetical protein